jgi:ribosomal protein L12E/L44/L45/RPP1/RPP2
MAYDIKITGLKNRDELLEKGGADHRLYKFELSGSPDNLWVLLLQRAGLEYPEVTISASADQDELWASATSDISVQEVLGTARKAVSLANADANESDRQFNQAAEAKAAAEAEAKERLVSELDTLSFEEDATAGLEPVPSLDSGLDSGLDSTGGSDEPGSGGV